MAEQLSGVRSGTITARIALNVISSWVANIVAGLIGLILVPLLLNKLGKDGYGIVYLLGTIVAFAGLADMGIRMALGRHLAEEAAKKEIEGFNRLASTGLAVCGALGLLGATICVSMADLLVSWFNVPDELVADSVLLIRWYGGGMVLLSFISPVFAAVITANHRFDTLNYLTTFQRIVRGLGLIVVLSLTTASLFGWAVVMLATEVLGLALTVILARRTWKGLAIGWRYLDKGALAGLFSLGGYLFILQLTNTINTQSDPLVLTTLLGPAAIALYSPSVSLSAAFRPLVFSLVYQLHPLSTDFHVTGRTAELQAILFRGTRYTLLLGIPVCVVMAVFADPIMRMWLYRAMGDDYKTVAHVLTLWAFVDLFFYAQGTQWPVLLGMNRIRFLAVIAIPMAIIGIVASVLLVKFTQLGVLGVVVSAVSCAVVVRPFYNWYTARMAGVGNMQYFVEGYFRPILVMVLLTGVALVIRQIAPTSIPALIACVTGVGLCWLPLCWWVGFYKEDRLSFASLLDTGLARFKGSSRPAASR